jgi:CheY-like chemotaxis protein
MQLVRLVDDLLDVSRITQGKIRLQMEPVEVKILVAQTVETCRPLIDARQQQLSVTVPQEPLWVYGDTVRLVQVLTNLLNNAAKYTDEGGHIWLSVASEQSDVVLRVRDLGIGIPSSMLSTIFDLFTQVDHSLDRSRGGLGIGLTLVRHLVQMHGGSVRAFSLGSNQGSEFVVSLPVHVTTDKPSVSRNHAAEPLPRGPCSRILVVDDNRDAADSLAILLRLQGYEVQTVYDGPTALAVINAFQPFLVLLDIGLPKMDGYEVARQLRQQPDLGEMILVALTGYSQEENRRRSQEAGFDYFIVKPINPQVLPALLATQGRDDLNSAPAIHTSQD